MNTDRHCARSFSCTHALTCDTCRLLHRNGLKLSDVDVWEIHEAFAGQVRLKLSAACKTEALTG